MRYKILGDSGLRVSELSLGTMTFGTDWGFGATEEESRKQFEIFTAAGGNFIDTANKYTDGNAERILGDLLGADRDSYVLGTKYSLDMKTGDLNAGGNHRKNLVTSLEKSLRRLKTDYIDVYWLHAWDYLTPGYEIMRALDDQVRAGKVRYLGISDAPAWVVAHLNTLATGYGWTPFTALQIPYSLLQRDVERELLPMARGMGLGVTAWAPLAGGVLSGKYTRGGDAPRRHGELTERQSTMAKLVAEIGDETGVAPANVALAWLRTRDVIPILGARTAKQLADNLTSLEVTLAERHLSRLDEASAVEMSFPHDFLAGEEWIHGGRIDQVQIPGGRPRLGR
ncbi:aryl-alcohol dehydrogenase-like predicted oxidoreductase [Stackebrandtia endophytica]|uniref:Aryl-alcohol dehydrogenase-like predicted oxidoreductase n=1 Tax=Stackebrandtia endophytica TaxID=1496996 RepID=A0A543AQS7_9ACTN|nr:aldo/keto reductase [Stackebrandtia endophytica]TQL74919.1 aryl-alcohol dehydrogenase-like predicted oxidoreductase [Stackebrandtia endophytica]